MRVMQIMHAQRSCTCQNRRAYLLTQMTENKTVLDTHLMNITSSLRSIQAEASVFDGSHLVSFATRYQSHG